jgi:hypothetical protein
MLVRERSGVAPFFLDLFAIGYPLICIGETGGIKKPCATAPARARLKSVRDEPQEEPGVTGAIGVRLHKRINPHLGVDDLRSINPQVDWADLFDGA